MKLNEITVEQLAALYPSQQLMSSEEVLARLLSYTDPEDTATEIDTTHLLHYMMKDEYPNAPIPDTKEEEMDSQIINHPVTRTLMLYTPPFDDYAYRGDGLKDMCLYNYCLNMYNQNKREKAEDGIPFESQHPYHTTHSQFRREREKPPSMSEKLYSLKPDSPNKDIREQYFCAISSLYFP
jgi:hypothetical protein